MNKLLINLLTLVFLSFTNPSFSNMAFEDGGGATVITIIDKTNTVSTTIDIPDTYYDTTGQLIVPLTVSIINNNGNVVYQKTTTSFSTNLSNSKLPSGTYTLLLEVGEILHKMEINL